MSDHWLRNRILASSSSHAGSRRPLMRRRWALERLEDRVLLSNQSVFTVDSTTDTGAGSGSSGDIAYVIGLVNQNPNPAGSFIQFSPTVFDTPQTISVGQINLTETAGPVIIKGPGSGNLTLNGANIVASGVGVVQIGKGVTASLAGMTISGGDFGVDVGRSVAAGGGIANHGSLAINNCTISDNTLGAFNSEGGGIYNDGTLSITSSTISDNTCFSQGEGGGIYNSGSLSITGSAIGGNTAELSGGGIFNSGALVITASTIAGNSSGNRAGGIANEGNLTATDSTIEYNDVINQAVFTVFSSQNSTFGGGALNDGIMTLLDCTFAYNSASDGAGIYNDSDSLSMFNCTVAFNTATDAGSSSGPIAGSGAGIYANSNPGPPPAGMTPSVPVVLENTIVAQNPYSGVHGSWDQNLATAPGASFAASSSYNLIGAGNTGSGLLKNGLNHNQVGVDNPGLQGLGFYGGPTQTIELEPGSSAIDAGWNALDRGQLTDGRGPGYARISGGTVDIGADEFQNQSATIVTRLSLLWGSNDASQLEIERGGNLLPQGRTIDMPWLSINRFQVQFSELMVLTSADIRIQSAGESRMGR